MANINIKGVRRKPDPDFSVAPYGNSTQLSYHLKSSATGVVDSDKATAVAIGDVIRLGVLPAGMLLNDILAIISDAFSASVTCKVGFLYVDGVDSTAVPQNDAYFIPAAQALSSVAVVRKTATTAPVVLPKDAFLVLTTAGAAFAEAAQADFIVSGVMVGVA